MPKIKVVGKTVQTNGLADGQLGGCYQVIYLPALQSYVENNTVNQLYLTAIKFCGFATF